MLMSSRHLFVLSTLAAAAGCSKSEGAAPKAASLGQEAAPASGTVAADRLIVPQHSVGEIVRTTDRHAFDALFARGKVTHSDCSLAQEEESVCSRVDLDGKPALLVVWDLEGKAEEVYVFSPSFATKAGLRVGLTLDELVARNGGAPVRLASAYDVDVRGDVHDGWMVDGDADGPLGALGLWLTVAIPPAISAKLNTEGASSGDAVLRGADVRVTSLHVRLDDLDPVEMEGSDEFTDEGADEGEEVTEDEGEDPVPTVRAELPAAAGDVRSVRWSELLYRCPTDCSPTFKKVIYGDVEGDGQEEAVVVTAPGILRDTDDETANLYGLRGGKVVWLGRVQESGYAHPEYDPTFVSAKLGRGTAIVTWRYHLWGEFENPGDDVETRVETFAIRGGVTQRIAATEK